MPLPPEGEGRGVAAQTSRAVELESVPPSTAREGVVDETRRSVTPPVASILAACPPPVGRDSCAPLADPTTPDRSLSSWRTSASRRTRACSRCSPGCSRTPPSTTRSPTTYGATIVQVEQQSLGFPTSSSKGSPVPPSGAVCAPRRRRFAFSEGLRRVAALGGEAALLRGARALSGVLARWTAAFFTVQIPDFKK